MNFRAQSSFSPKSVAQAMQALVPRMVAAVTDGCGAVVLEAQTIVPVDTGQLKDSIHTASVSLVGTVVEGTVTADAPHAGFVEFGTGLRGEGTYPYPLPQTGVPYTGNWVYDFRKQNWIGHPAQPYMRPALDASNGAIKDAFRKQGFSV